MTVKKLKVKYTPVPLINKVDGWTKKQPVEYILSMQKQCVLSKTGTCYSASQQNYHPSSFAQYATIIQITRSLFNLVKLITYIGL